MNGCRAASWLPRSTTVLYFLRGWLAETREPETTCPRKSERGTMTARRVRLSALVLRALLLAALVVGSSGAPEAETPPFDKEELEALLRKEHSQRVSNIYDSEKGIQCAPPHSPVTFFRPRFFFATSRSAADPWQVHLEHRESGAVPGR